MFKQTWAPLISWCYPPPSQVARVIALLRSQRARAAVMFPLRTLDIATAQQCRLDSPGVRYVWRLPLTSPPAFYHGNFDPLPCRLRMHIVFFDFADVGTSLVSAVVPAESLPTTLALTGTDINYLSLPDPFVSNRYLCTAIQDSAGKLNRP